MTAAGAETPMQCRPQCEASSHLSSEIVIGQALAPSSLRTYHEPMPQLSLQRKLAILSDAAKYDASCASPGSVERDSSKSGGIGSTEGMGICHSYAPDGRCISLLKI